MNCINLVNITKIYKNRKLKVEALKRINLTVKDGEFLSIVGNSGSGKSTLLNILGCLDVPTEGNYSFFGENVYSLSENCLSEIRNRKIGFVFQSYNLISSLSALENTELPLMYRGISRSERKQMALEALQMVGLYDRAAHRPGELSGGQQQRVAIARAIASNPMLLLADEPTGNLDQKAGHEVMDMLFELNRQGCTVIMITHDKALAAMTPRIETLQEGEII